MVCYNFLCIYDADDLDYLNHLSIRLLESIVKDKTSKKKWGSRKHVCILTYNMNSL